MPRPTLRIPAPNALRVPSPAAVEELKQRLRVFGFKLAPGGVFDAATDGAVRAFQTSRRLVSDGVVGEATWEALFDTDPASVRQGAGTEARKPKPARRQAEHGGRFVLERITQSPVTRGEARAIEQALINRNPGFENIRNSISPNHSWYGEAVEWGEGWLRGAGY